MLTPLRHYVSSRSNRHGDGEASLSVSSAYELALRFVFVILASYVSDLKCLLSRALCFLNVAVICSPRRGIFTRKMGYAEFDINMESRTGMEMLIAIAS